MNAKRTQPTIAMVVPTYLRDDLLRACLDSVVAQKDSDVTVYIGDNAASDETRAVVETYDDRFIYKRWAANLGAPGNYAQLVLEATEDYIVCLHDDNILLPEFVARVRGVVTSEPDIDIVFSGFDLIDGEGKPMPSHQLSKLSFRSKLPAGRLTFGRRTRSYVLLIRQSFQPAVPCLIRRSVLQPHIARAAESITYDYHLMAALGLSNATLFYVPESIALSRVHERSYTQSVGWVPDRLAETRRLGTETSSRFDQALLKLLALRDVLLLRYAENPAVKVAFKTLDALLFRWSDAPLKALVGRRPSARKSLSSPGKRIPENFR